MSKKIPLTFESALQLARGLLAYECQGRLLAGHMTTSQATMIAVVRCLEVAQKSKGKLPDKLISVYNLGTSIIPTNGLYKSKGACETTSIAKHCVLKTKEYQNE